MFTKRMLMGLLIVALALAALAILPVGAQEENGPPSVGLRPDAPTYALHGPYWVGTEHLKASKTELHPTRVEVWYPALNPEGSEEAVTLLEYNLPNIGHALKNAAPDVEHGPYPLVIFAYGLNGNRLVNLYLCEHLASYGFVVLAIDYADAPATPAVDSVARTSLNYTRPRDVSWQIDYAASLTAAGGDLEGMIDLDRIAVVGHSLGGYTALSAAGAQLDIDGPTSWCANYPEMSLPEEIGSINPCSDFTDNTKKKLAALAGLEAVPDGLWPSWGDDRVDAIVPLAPGAFSFGSDSLKAVTIPTMVMVGSADNTIFSENPFYRSYIYENLDSSMKSLVVFEQAGHTIFNNDCDVWPWVIDQGLFWVCSDPVWDMDRAHDLINHFTTAFLLDVLEGDKDAHTALLAENVNFPGITYETTMK